jgi:hypothetical protein
MARRQPMFSGCHNHPDRWAVVLQMRPAYWPDQPGRVAGITRLCEECVRGSQSANMSKHRQEGRPVQEKTGPEPLAAFYFGPDLLAPTGTD